MAKDSRTKDSTANPPKRSMMYTGSGMAIGAALGLVFGLLLWGEVAWGLIIGVAAGLIVGATIDAQTGG